MTDVAVSGGLSVDHIVVAPVTARFDRLGGPGLYAALGARLVTGTNVLLHAALPAAEPEFATTLASAGIDLAHCVEVADVPRVWILDSPHGRRVVDAVPPPGVELDAPEPEPDRAPPPQSLLAAVDGVLHCAPRALDVPPAGPVVGVDPDQREVARRGLAYWRAIAVPGGVVLPSRVQLAGLGPEPRRAARELAATTGVAVVARLDREGAFAVQPDGQSWNVHDEQAGIVDTTGAGDASAGAVVAALAAGADLPTATAYGVSVARIVLSDWGHTALLRHAPLAGPLPGVQIDTDTEADIDTDGGVR